ncbi:MAG: TrkH family potassium uptake protein [Chloroflexota bacterium]
MTIGKGRMRIKLAPAQVLVLGFAAVILAGAILLTLPISSQAHVRTPFIDALFTATSATCVTGLIVVNTATHWSTFGQLVILALIQIGGLGIMTMATLFALMVGRRISFRERILIQEGIGKLDVAGVVKLTKYILASTFIIEGTGALILFIRWLRDLPPAKAAYFGIFHAISSFCNAGFDLWGDSLVRFVDDVTVNLVIGGLIIVGGLGFYVLADIWKHRRFSALNLHSKVVIRATVFLIIAGTVLMYVLEMNNPATLGPLSFKGKVLASWFAAVTPRTAGYNSINVGAMTDAGLFLTIVLMFIGASPGSTGGGIKTTTFTTLLLAVWTTITGKSEVETFQRRLAREVIDKALVISMISLLLLLSVTLVLAATQPARFLAVLFEATSGFGTVGLSMGITPTLTTLGKSLIILLMYAGRVGPLTLAMALTIRHSQANIRLPEDRVVIG